MSLIPTSSKMDFDYSVTTEKRFALRAWLERFIDNANGGEEASLAEMLSTSFNAKGFLNIDMDAAAFTKFLQERDRSEPPRVIRFPELKIKRRDETYFAVGTFEQFQNNIIVYEGTVEIEVNHNDETSQFTIQSMAFFPRMKPLYNHK